MPSFVKSQAWAWRKSIKTMVELCKNRYGSVKHAIIKLVASEAQLKKYRRIKTVRGVSWKETHKSLKISCFFVYSAQQKGMVIKMIKLIDVDRFGFDRNSAVLELDVEESQKAYVANVAVILGRAYVFRSSRPRAFFICSDDTPVGMALYYDCPEQRSYDFSQIFIDRRYQGRGYGKAAVKLILDEMKQDGTYSKVTICYVEGNDASRKLFEQFGFVEISHDWDEISMEKSLI